MRRNSGLVMFREHSFTLGWPISGTRATRDGDVVVAAVVYGRADSAPAIAWTTAQIVESQRQFECVSKGQRGRHARDASCIDDGEFHAPRSRPVPSS